jgi:hypothetical protein
MEAPSAHCCEDEVHCGEEERDTVRLTLVAIEALYCMYQELYLYEPRNIVTDDSEPNSFSRMQYTILHAQCICMKHDHKVKHDNRHINVMVIVFACVLISCVAHT